MLEDYFILCDYVYVRLFISFISCIVPDYVFIRTYYRFVVFCIRSIIHYQGPGPENFIDRSMTPAQKFLHLVKLFSLDSKRYGPKDCKSPCCQE